MRGKRVKELQRLASKARQNGHLISFRRVKRLYYTDRDLLYQTLDEMIRIPKEMHLPEKM